ncbi:S-DNA-T family DNA segregation ATPase FtsK/SpoIIIE [Knoellia remsis]|uniref:S-DNA-T family DNA segregation ATPase FtsK/SpoIIIE n=1 Tax=Knoellia remsis TaxID=407159 RepID=A0A2T0UTL1_9MICO|nr:FtsK/SpoIIIE domain-containing protein [Knoellia remsis]PRY61271.1 S-DNA-T family DNA segregation ATPase FtsK/SpoIIIE [Knoellia remsis]
MQSTISLALTVRPRSRSGDAVDLRVTAPHGTTLADVLPLLAEATGEPPGAVSCRGAALGPDATWGAPPLLHGATLCLDDPHPTGSPRPSTATAVDLVVVAGPDAGRRVAVPREGLVVGRSAGIGLSLADDRLSRRHARISPEDNGFRVLDLGSTNGLRCGGTDIPPGGEHDVDGSELIGLGDSVARLARAGTATAPTTARGDGRVAVNRSPRPLPPRRSAVVRAPRAPDAPRRGRIPWLSAALPVPFAALLAFFFGPQMLAFALLSPLMLVGSVVGDRWSGRREHARELAQHAEELAARRSELDELHRLERHERWAELPDPATVLEIANGPGARLWERRRGAADAGRVRLGVGDLPARTAWVPDDGMSGSGEPQHLTLAQLPVEVGLDEVGGLGIAGPADDVAGVLRQVLGQLVTAHSPRDLRLVVRAGVRHDEPQSWTRWLPHTTAYGDASTCLEALRQVVRTREEEREHGGRTAWPTVVAVLPDADADPTAGELADLLERGRELAVHCLVGAQRAAALPAACHAVVTIHDGRARLDVDGSDPVPSFVPDRTRWWWGERLGRALAPLVDAAGDAEALPTSLDLAEATSWLDPECAARTISDQWSTTDGRPVAVLGRTAGDDWSVDLSTDGPHLLVGGTTGSGKSELLRTLVTSLALHSSPEDVTFVLVDYKGGSAFGECADLPHTVGLVTNLDEGLARRALTSLEAEITRRERLLADSGARDFDDHRRRRGGLPRLVIVIDEFRVLADELPDFVDGVVSLAAVGRSLGVHLILATQRPAGAITADIQANVNLRIAMRVRDVADSQDVIGSADAAHLPADRPGRGFARGGDGELVEFQAARVGTPGESRRLDVVALDAQCQALGPVRSTNLDAATGTAAVTALDLAALSAAAGEAARALSLDTPHRPWLPALSEQLTPAGLPRDAVGLADLPAEQRQVPVSHRANEGHWLVVGGPRSGRSTALRTILASHVAEPGSDLSAYVIDTSGDLADLEELPHVGAVVHAAETTRVRRLLDLLRTSRDTATEREGRRPGSTARRPAASTLLLVDGWERLDSDDDFALGGVRDGLLDLLRSGDPSLRVVVTGDRSLLTGKLSTIASQTLLLPLADPADAVHAGLSRRDLPASRAPGRAIRLGDRVELQLARRDPHREAAERDPRVAPPTPVTRLPHLVDHDTVLTGHGALFRAPDALADTEYPATGPVPTLGLAVGLSASTGGVAMVDPARMGRRLLVIGHPGTGRSCALAAIGRSAAAAGRTVAVVEGATGTVARAVGTSLRVHPWDVEALVAARREHPDLVVLVDDAEQVEGSAAEPVLEEITSLVERDGGLVVAATTPTVASTTFRGLVATLARAQAGLLLSPRTPADGDTFGIRAPRGVDQTPGRALLVAGRRHDEVQLALVRTAREVAA